MVSCLFIGYRVGMCCCFAIIVSCIIVSRESKAADQFAPTFVGGWLVEETHDLAPYVRQSGRDGLASVLFAPLDRELNKNGFFYISCIDGKTYLEVNIPENLVPSSEGNYSVTVNLDGSNFSNKVRVRDAYPVSYLEHGMLKSEVGENFMDLFKDTSPTNIKLVTERGSVDFIYKNEKREQAVGLFLEKCARFKTSSQRRKTDHG